MATVVRVSCLGAMPGGEVWSVNPVWFLQNEPTEVTSTEALAIANALRLLTIPTGLRAAMNSATTFTGYRVEARSRTGALEAQAESVIGTPVPGTGSSSHPYQTSLVTSLRSGFPGAQGRGRLYWPTTGIAINPVSLRADNAQLVSMLSAVKTHLTAIQSAVAAQAGPADLCVWSRTGSDFHKVTTLRQGDVLDTQRRRRDALSESYSELVYP